MDWMEEQEKKTKKEIKRIILEIRNKYPKITRIASDFSGESDCFDSFYNTEVSDANDEKFKFDDEHEASLLIDELMGYFVDLDSRCYFDNEGCKGCLEFNFITNILSINVEYPETTWQDQGSIEIEFECTNIKPEKSFSAIAKNKNKKKKE